MIIINDREGIISLPYKKNRTAYYVDFFPGKNELTEEVWTAINKEMGARIKNYRNLKVFSAVKTEEVKSIDGKKLKVEVGATKIEFTKLTDHEAKDLVENTMEVEELEQYLVEEKAQKEPRQHIINKINEQLEKVNEIINRLKDSKKNG